MSRELSEELTRSSAFRWMPEMLAGMQNDEGKIVVWMRVVSVRRGLITAAVDRYESAHPRAFTFERANWDKAPPLPDLNDPATVGCLLTLLQARKGEVSVEIAGDKVRVCASGLVPIYAATAGEAIAKVLVALGGAS